MARARITKRVREALAALPDEFILCRDYGHAPRYVGRWPERRRRDGSPLEIVRWDTCVRCGTGRFTTFSYPKMERLGAKYVYPEGYELHLGFLVDERLPRAAVRIESMRRQGPMLDAKPEGDAVEVALQQIGWQQS